MGHLGNEHLSGHRRNAAFHNASAGVDMVHNVQGRGFIVQQLKHFHELHHVFGVVEIPHPHVLDLYHHGIQFPQLVRLKGNMVGPRGELRLPRVEHGYQILPFPEDVVHPSAPGGIPAVLGAETAHLAVQQGAVQLILQRCGPE